MAIKIMCMIFVLLFCSARSEVTQEVLKALFEQHCAQLKNTAIAHDPLAIVFSGTIGMGKTTVAKQLEKKYQAVRVSTDALRALPCLENTPIKDRENILQQYISYFFKHYAMPNKRFIFDASIDRKYVTLFPFLEKNNIKFIVVRLKVPKDIIIKRLHEREGENVTWYLNNLDTMLLDYDNFGKKYKNYITYTNSDDAQINTLICAIDDTMIRLKTENHANSS